MTALILLNLALLPKLCPSLPIHQDLHCTVKQSGHINHVIKNFATGENSHLVLSVFLLKLCRFMMYQNKKKMLVC